VAAAILVEIRECGLVVEPESLAGCGECCSVSGGSAVGNAVPVEELAMGGVAEIVALVAVSDVERIRADDDGESAQGLRRVGWTGLAGYDAFDVGFDGEGDGEDEFAVACGDGERVVEGFGFVVGRKSEGAGEVDCAERCAFDPEADDEVVSVGANGERPGLSKGLATLAVLPRRIRTRGNGELFVVPQSPEADTEG